ncbi:hypothetical protein E1B28_009623 [Marasmius oreades]|uniref:F-box domain-containing protein n=1 Tax=Marasmius oreades TaxID=181124 RepID=A0A9P7RVN7_9AGAR|nr:uncharacterized protein E1B28_009623 [Marasmius oreades]KAG7090510.1 hypothetical protein E1B28_009623 [Marasmius oreades]
MASPMASTSAGIPSMQSQSRSGEKNSKRVSLPIRHTVTAFDRGLITQSLIDAEGELKEHKMELNRLKAAIIAVEGRRAAVERDIKGYRSLLSPIQKMPPEILTEIFGYCSHDVDMSGEAMPMPIVISMVCGRWREQALSTPSMWSSINIYISPQNDEGPDKDWLRMLRLTRLFLERSSTSRLKVDLTWFTNGLATDPEIDVVLVDHIMEALHWNTHRLYDFRLKFTSVLAHNFSFQRLRTSYPILRRLELSINEYTDGFEVYAAPTNFFEILPALHSVSLIGKWAKSGLIVPWGTLSTLHLSGNVTGLRSMLTSCTNLRRLELHDMGIPAMDYYAQEGQIFSNIEQLSITCTTSISCLAHILEHLTLPCVSTLELNCVIFIYRSGPLALEALEDLLVRSGCNITSFSLNRVIFPSPTSLVPLLYRMPTIRDLTFEELTEDSLEGDVHNLTVISPFLHHLDRNHRESSSVSNPAGPFLPQLTDLKLIVHEDGLEEDSLMNAIGSRWSDRGSFVVNDSQPPANLDVVTLKSVEIGVLTWNEQLSESILGLECFRDAGLRISVRWIQPTPFLLSPCHEPIIR